MDEQIIFTTNSTGSITNIHSYEQANLKQCTVSSQNSAVRVGEQYLFVAQAQKSLIHVYNSAYNVQRESVEQRLPLPERVNCLEVVENNASIYDNSKVNENKNGNLHNLPQFNLPYLLLASTESGKLYIWELNSGILLNVKSAAHYQAITKIKSIMNGKYIITSGNDSRVIIWQTSDLVSQDEPKPVAILHDHTLPVTDFEVSSIHGGNLFTSGIKLYTVSRDSTLRCYDLSTLMRQGNNKKRSSDGKNDEKVQLLCTFTLPYPINCISLDPAERSVYLGTQMGCYSVSLYYQLNGNRLLNLLQPSTGATQGNIYSLIEEPQETINKDALFVKNQLICNKIIEENIVYSKISMDGSIILLGDKNGRVHITEIFSKQVMKTLQPLTTSQTMIGEVTNILLSTYSTEANDNLSMNLTKGKQHNGNNNSTLEKLPALQRVIMEKGQTTQTHDVWYQIGELYNGQSESTETVQSPLLNFEEYLQTVQSEENAFISNGNVSSEIITTTSAATATSTDPSKQEEIDNLKQKVTSLTEAYAELREIHEKLYEQHQQSQK